MRILQLSRFTWLGIGLLLGGTTQLALSTDKPPPEPVKNPNVVILRGEKIVSLEKPNVPLKEMAAAFSKQTGYAITLDKEYQDDDAPYQFLLSRVPLTRALSAVGYLAHGRWDRTKSGYHLHLLSASERASDISQYEVAVQKAEDYLAKIDPDDPSLDKDRYGSVKSWLQGARMRHTDLAPLPLDSMASWSITASDGRLGVSYTEGPDGTSDGKVHTRYETWRW
jgi:hypothetical protein